MIQHFPLSSCSVPLLSLHIRHPESTRAPRHFEQDQDYMEIRILASRGFAKTCPVVSFGVDLAEVSVFDEVCSLTIPVDTAPVSSKGCAVLWAL